MKRLYRLCAVLLFALGLGAPAMAQSYTVRDVAVWALEQDAQSWVWNRLDYNSAGEPVRMDGYDPGNDVYRMGYTYNGGSYGWIEVFLRNGEFVSLRFHDNQTWREINYGGGGGGYSGSGSGSSRMCPGYTGSDGIPVYVPC